MPIIIEGLQGGPAIGQTIDQWIKDATIETAERVLRDEVGQGFDDRPVVITDGVTGRDYRSVKPFGGIEFAARTNMADAVLWALDELRKRSPVLTGRYVNSHVVLLNGAEIRGDIRRALMQVKPGDRVQVVNPQPYARKLEGATASKRTGRSKRAASSRQAKGGVYRVVQRAVLQRFGRQLFCDFAYVRLDTGVKVWGRQGGKGGRRVQRDQVYPAIRMLMKSNDGG